MNNAERRRIDEIAMRGAAEASAAVAAQQSGNRNGQLIKTEGVSNASAFMQGMSAMNKVLAEMSPNNRKKLMEAYARVKAGSKRRSRRASNISRKRSNRRTSNARRRRNTRRN
jgi:hypothetical protein